MGAMKRLLACLLYLLFVPITLIQAFYYLLYWLSTGEWLFYKYNPLSHWIFDIVSR